MSDFYTNVALVGNTIFYRGVVNGERKNFKVDYQPTLFVKSNKKTKYRTLDGVPVEPFSPGGVRDCREFIEQYKGVDGFKIYGNTDYIYQFIGDYFNGEVDYDPSKVVIANLDIETTCEHGFPDVDNPIERLIAITIEVNGNTTVFGCGEFHLDYENTVCHQCETEEELVQSFLTYWEKLQPDIITGWNTKFFDMPYLFSRIAALFTEKEAKRLSPFRKTRHSLVNTRHGEKTAVDIVGIANIDYLDLYRTFTYTNQESYKLDHIAFVELGERKVSYDEYDSIQDFYTNDFQKFMDYNYHDVHLVRKLEGKMKLLELALALAYSAKVNYADVFSQVRTWDQIIYHHLRSQDIVIPLKKGGSKDTQYAGAYVKEPILGYKEWIVSFDLNSLYPHLIMQYNISPETKVDIPVVPGKPHCIGPENILNGPVNDKYAGVAKCYESIKQRKNKGYSVAANGVCFRRDKQGFLPALMEKMYQERKHYKKLMLQAEKEKQTLMKSGALGADVRKHIEEKDYEIAKYNNFQLVRKIQLNSAYGAIGNQWFRYYDVDMAEAITLSGQLSIRWIQEALNGFLNTTLKTEGKDYILASDTDSVYIHLGDLVSSVYAESPPPNEVVDFLDRSCNEIIEPFIQREYERLAELMNAYTNKMIMGREVIADKGIWTAKKRYMLNVWDSEGVRYAKPKLKIMGIETTRSSTPMVVRTKLKEAISLVLSSDEQTIQKFIADFKQEFKSLPPEDVAFPRGCNGMVKYRDASSIYRKGTPIAVKGALLYNFHLKDKGLDRKYEVIKDGEKVKFLYLKVPNTINDTVVSFTSRLPVELDLHEYVDYNKQFEVSFLEPLKTILVSREWSAEKTATLEGLFG